MTPSARAAVRELLDRMEADRAEEEAALLQHDGPAFLQEVTRGINAKAKVIGNDDSSDEGNDDDVDGQESSNVKAADSIVLDAQVSATTMTTTPSVPTPTPKKA